MDLVISVVVVLLVVMAAGHGLWVAAAWLLRGGRSRKERAAYEPTLSDDRAATARYLQHLRSTGSVDEQTHARLMRLIAEEVRPIRSVEDFLGKRRAAADVDADAADALRYHDEARRLLGSQAPQATVEPVPDTPVEAAPEVEAEAEAIPTTVESVPPRTPRRPLSEILAGFMAEKNIRWGELVGGLLIVGSSTALVISLWSQIEAIPLLKFIIFTTLTAALFGAGLFVYHRWDLPTTGHALLIISTLLVPLNVLAFAAFSPPRSFGGGVAVTAEGIAVALFGWLTLLAGRAVIPDAARLFAGGVTGLSACSLLVRFVFPTAGAALVTTSLAPIGLYVLVIAASLWRPARVRPLGDEHAKTLLLQLGVQTFACLVPLGLLLYQAGGIGSTVRQLSPLVCALVAPALGTGLFLWRRLAVGTSPQVRTAGAGVTLIAAGVMVLGVGLGWPVPSRLLPATLVNGVALVAVSRLVRHPAVHAAAVVWFAGAWMLGVQLVLGGVSWSTSAPEVLLRALLSAATGQALVAVAAVCVGVAAWLARRQRHVLSVAYGVTAMAFAALSLALVTWFGFGITGDKQHVTWVYALYAAGAFGLTWRLRSPVTTWVGCILGQMAIAQLVVYGPWWSEGPWSFEHFAWPTALLIGASACGVTTAMLRWLHGEPDRAGAYAPPLTGFAVDVSIVAAAWMALALRPEAPAAFSVRSGWLFALWLVLALLTRGAGLMAASQVALAVAACAAAQHHLHGLPWYQALASPLRGPWLWQTHLSIIGGLALAWGLTRVAIGRLYRQRSAGGEGSASATTRVESRLGNVWRLLNPSFRATDRWMAPLALLGLVLLSMWSVWPAVVAEHGWQRTGASFGDYTHASGLGSWLLLIIVVATLVVRLREGFYGLAAQGLLVTLACAVALVAANFESAHRVVSVLRWLNALALIVVSVAVWTGGYWLDHARRLIGSPPPREPAATIGPRFLLLGMLGTIVVLLTITFADSLAAGEALIPAGTSDPWLHISLLAPATLVAVSLIGHGATQRRAGYAVAATVLTCTIVTIVELSFRASTGPRPTPSFVVWLVQLNAMVFAASALLCRALLGWTPRPEAPAQYPRWPLLIGRAAICVTLFLVAGAVWVRPGAVPPAVVAAGTVWGVLAVLLLEWALFSAGSAAAITERWHQINLWLIVGAVLVACVLARLDTGNWLCFHTLLVGFVAAGWLRIPLGTRRVRELVGAGWQETFDAASARTAAPAREIDHDLSCANCEYNLRGLPPSGRCPECNAPISESLEAAVNRLTPQWTAQLSQTRIQTAVGVFACTTLASLFALRAMADDPQKPWWSAGALLALSALGIALAGWAPRRGLAYLAGVEACLAVSVWWMALHYQAAATFAGNLTNLLNVNVVALTLAGLAWFVVERKVLRRKLAAASLGAGPVFHHAVAALCTVVITTLAAAALYHDAIERPISALALPSWLAWFLAAGLMLTGTVRPTFRHVPAGLYVLGLAAVGLILAQSNLSPRTLAWALSLSLAGYVLLTSIVARLCTQLDRDGSARFGETAWLPEAELVLTAAAILLAGYVSLTDLELPVRMLVVVSPLLCAAAAVLLPAGDRRGMTEAGACALLTIAAVLFAWVWIPPESGAGLLDRSVGVIAAIGAMTVVASATVAWARPGPSWMIAVGHVGAGSTGLAAVLLTYCSAHEVFALVGGKSVEFSQRAVVTLLAALAVMAACCIAFALFDRLDPFRLPPAARETYVYVAEGLAALLALHIRASMPWLFTGFITQYWPILVMALALTAIAVGEICDRLGIHAAARPLGRTGLFLPALSLLDFFLMASRVDFAIVLLTFGALYAVLAGLRRSVVFGSVAAAALIASLWHLLHHTPGLGITRHPQLWFIPPALAAFAAGHLNRARLDAKQRASLHYACLFAVYLSSTADIFLVGVAQAPWLPLVLAGLSVTGILAGIAFRIRSFLQMGTGFLCLSLLTIIWHAAANLGWTWVWYVAGIALGLALITIFALFEKKRTQMTALLEEVRRWPD